jgi:hypothetical protein
MLPQSFGISPHAVPPSFVISPSCLVIHLIPHLIRNQVISPTLISAFAVLIHLHHLLMQSVIPDLPQPSGCRRKGVIKA